MLEKSYYSTIYHLYVLNADNEITEEFSNLKFSQPVIDLYPQFDRDNVEENPQPANSGSTRQDEKNKIIAACVEQVMEILSKNQER